MNARAAALDVSRRLYGDAGEGFAADCARYAAGFGELVDEPDAFALAHLVHASWPLERMRIESDPAGDCWFIFLAAGSPATLVRILGRKKFTSLVAFERRGLPFLWESTKLPWLHDPETTPRRWLSSKRVCASNSEPIGSKRSS